VGRSRGGSTAKSAGMAKSASSKSKSTPIPATAPKRCMGTWGITIRAKNAVEVVRPLKVTGFHSSRSVAEARSRLVPRWR